MVQRLGLRLSRQWPGFPGGGTKIPQASHVALPAKQNKLKTLQKRSRYHLVQSIVKFHLRGTVYIKKQGRG